MSPFEGIYETKTDAVLLRLHASAQVGVNCVNLRSLITFGIKELATSILSQFLRTLN